MGIILNKNIKNQMRTATIALLLAAVNAADAVKDDAKKAADAAATGAAEGQACDSSKDKMGCATGLKCAIGGKVTVVTKSETDKKAAAGTTTKGTTKADAKTTGSVDLDSKFAAYLATWTAADAKYKLFDADR